MNTIIRGIQAVRADLDPKAVLTDLTKAFAEFKAGSDSRIDHLERLVARGGHSYGGDGGGLGNDNSPAKAEHVKAFDAWFRFGVDAGLKDKEVQAGLRTNSDPDGGYLVPETLDRNLDRVASSAVAMRRLANIVTISEGEYKRPISQGGTGAGWVGETDDRNATDSPGLAMFNPAWCELSCMPEVTQKLLDLAGFDVGAWLVDEIGIAENELEGAAFITGNGVGRPKGILAYETVANASWSFGKVGFVVSGSASALNSSDRLIDLQHALRPVYRQNGVFLMNDTTWSIVRKFKDGDGAYIWRPGLEPGAPDMLLGKPVEIDDFMPNIGAGAFPIAFGDFTRAYTIGNHTAGRRLIRDELTRKGWVRFYMSKRVFGGLHNTEAIKLLKVAA